MGPASHNFHEQPCRIQQFRTYTRTSPKCLHFLPKLLIGNKHFHNKMNSATCNFSFASVNFTLKKLENYQQILQLSPISHVTIFPPKTFPGNSTSCNIQRQTGMKFESGAMWNGALPGSLLVSNVHECLAPSHFCLFPWNFCLHTYWLFSMDL